MIINPYVFGVPATDPYWANVVLLLQGDTLTSPDVSTSALTWETIGGMSVTSSNSPPGTQTDSWLFDGTAGGRVLHATALNMGSGDFCIEQYVRATRANCDSSAFMLFKGADGTVAPYCLYLPNKDDISGIASKDAATYGVLMETTGGAVADVTWYHGAMSREGDNYKLWQDGTQVDTTDVMTGAVADNSENLEVGRTSISTLKFGGQMAGIRITKGVARYTTTFTPPTLPFPTS